MTQETKSNALAAASAHPSWRKAIGPRPTITAQNGFPAKRASLVKCCGLLVEFTNGCIIAMPNQKRSVRKQTHLVENINKGEIPFAYKTELEAGNMSCFGSRIGSQFNNLQNFTHGHTGLNVTGICSFFQERTESWKQCKLHCIARWRIVSGQLVQFRPSQ
jgi:hypothetical protein